MKLTGILACLALTAATFTFGQHRATDTALSTRKPPDDHLIAKVELGNQRPFYFLVFNDVDCHLTKDAGMYQVLIPGSEADEAYKLLVQDSGVCHYWLCIQNPEGKWETFGARSRKIDRSDRWIAEVEQGNNRPISLLEKHGFRWPGIRSSSTGLEEVVVPERRSREAYKLLVRDSKRRHYWLNVQNPKGKWETYGKMKVSANGMGSKR